jgi:hypothetical protein
MLLALGCTSSEATSSRDLPRLQPAMSIEIPRQEEVRLPFTVSGWAVDLAALKGPGIGLVQIPDERCDGAAIGIAQYGRQFRHSGWRFEVEMLRPGEHALAVPTESSGVDAYSQCEAIQITVE